MVEGGSGDITRVLLDVSQAPCGGLGAAPSIFHEGPGAIGNGSGGGTLGVAGLGSGCKEFRETGGGGIGSEGSQI